MKVSSATVCVFFIFSCKHFRWHIVWTELADLRSTRWYVLSALIFCFTFMNYLNCIITVNEYRESMNIHQIDAHLFIYLFSVELHREFPSHSPFIATSFATLSYGVRCSHI